MNTLKTYDANSDTIDSLSEIIETGTGGEKSAAREKLILLLPQQIALVKALEDKTWEEAVEHNALVIKLDDQLFRGDESIQEEHSSALTKAEEIKDRACRYGIERKVLQMLLDIETETKRREQHKLTIMSASHPRAVAVSPLGKLDKDLLAKIAVLSLKWGSCIAIHFD